MKNILVIGAGRFGRYTTIKLHYMGHQTMVVDKDEERINKILEELNQLIGLTTVKEEVTSLINIQKINVRRRKLEMKEAELLMKAAGFAFSATLPEDEVFAYCIKNKIWNIEDVNDIMVRSGLKSIM